MPSETIPEPVRLVADFVNTLEIDVPADAIGTPQALGAWLTERGLLEAGVTPGRYDVRAATSMREALRDLLEANAGGGVAHACVDDLNTAAAHGRLVVRVAPDGRATLAADAPGVAGALGRIMAAVYTSMTDGSWERLKPCRSKTCRWVFYDRSKNRSGTWCSMKVCGNREKVRSFRERHRG